MYFDMLDYELKNKMNELFLLKTETLQEIRNCKICNSEVDPELNFKNECLSKEIEFIGMLLDNKREFAAKQFFNR